MLCCIIRMLLNNVSLSFTRVLKMNNRIQLIAKIVNEIKAEKEAIKLNRLAMLADKEYITIEQKPVDSELELVF